MNTESTKQILIDIAAGNLSAEVLDPEHGVSEEWKFDHDSCTTLELYKLLEIAQAHGTQTDQWPVSYKSFFDKLKEEIPDRKPKDYFLKTCFWYEYNTGELSPIMYKDPSKKPKYQLCVGHPKGEHPKVIYAQPLLFFYHLNLDEWEPGIDFSKILELELPRIAEIIKIEGQGQARSSQDQIFINELICDTKQRERIEKNYDCKRAMTDFIIHYKNGTIRIESK